MQVKHTLFIISPYFIPSDELMKNIKLERERGVNVIIITNSLASTDVFPVYSGYKDFIKPLLVMYDGVAASEKIRTQRKAVERIVELQGQAQPLDKEHVA